MKCFSILSLVVFVLFACNQPSAKVQSLQSQLDSFKNEIYKPGFGEFMSSIQVHHEKLWFAGINQNWQLANFEINEINENIEDITKYCTDRPETKEIGMIQEPIKNISMAIEQKNEKEFRNGFITLTITCNNCHRETNHGFNVISIPTTPPFSNQVYKPQAK